MTPAVSNEAWFWRLGEITFAHPKVLWLMVLAPLFVAGFYLFDRARRGQLTRRLGELPVIGRVIASASPGRRLLKDILLAVALMLIAFASARPQLEGRRKVELRGLDLVLAVDVSKSMLVDDVDATENMEKKKIEKSRLARARELARAVIDELAGDRIGPMVFAGGASHFPLTEDHQAAAEFLENLGPNDLPPGSNTAEVFRVSRCLLRPDLYEDLGCSKISGRRGHGGDPLRGESLDSKLEDEDEKNTTVEEVERGKAILIFTDGGEADAATVREVATARELGIAVFIVGVGSVAGGVVYEVDSFTGKRTSTAKTKPDGTPVISKRDDAGMAAIAAAGGDEKRYLIAEPTGKEVKPMPIVEALRAVNRGLATKQVRDMRELYQSFLFAALMLLVIEVAIGTRKRQRFPEAAASVDAARPPPPPPAGQPMFENPALSAMLPLGTQSVFSVIAAYVGVLAVIPPIIGWWTVGLVTCGLAALLGTAGLVDIALRPQKRGIARAIIGISLGIVGVAIMGLRWL